MLIVKKYGDISIADTEKIMRVAISCAAEYQKGNDIVMVVSAMGSYTDKLMRMALEINPDPSARELDMLLATGEQMSAALMSMALDSLGIPAISLNAQQVKIYTTEEYGNAHIINMEATRIQAELATGKIVIVTGFQGIAANQDYTTLGKGGADATALALAAMLHADTCEIDTNKNGVSTIAHSELAMAQKRNTISDADIHGMTLDGADVLHSRCVEMVRNHRIPLVVRASRNRREGTRIPACAGQK